MVLVLIPGTILVYEEGTDSYFYFEFVLWRALRLFWAFNDLSTLVLICCGIFSKTLVRQLFEEKSH